MSRSAGLESAPAADVRDRSARFSAPEGVQGARPWKQWIRPETKLVASEIETADSSRWWQLGLLAVVELFAMALWFSATAVAPALAAEWRLTADAATWLTTS